MKRRSYLQAVVKDFLNFNYNMLTQFQKLYSSLPCSHCKASRKQNIYYILFFYHRSLVVVRFFFCFCFFRNCFYTFCACRPLYIFPFYLPFLKLPLFEETIRISRALFLYLNANDFIGQIVIVLFNVIQIFWSTPSEALVSL